MNTSISEILERKLSDALAGEVRFDLYSKALYSTDASLYQIQPIGVVIPKDKPRCYQDGTNRVRTQGSDPPTWWRYKSRWTECR